MFWLVKNTMDGKKFVDAGRLMSFIILPLILLLIGAYPVAATSTYNTATPVYSGGEGVIMFSPAPGYLLVQSTVMGRNPGVPLYSSFYSYKVTWKNESHNDKSFTMDLSYKDFKESGKTSNTIYYDVKNAAVNEVNYIFSYDNGLRLDQYTIVPGQKTSDKWQGHWGSERKINYKFDSSNSDLNNFEVVGSTDGIYLISKHTINKVPTLDISFIQKEDLEGTSATITPKQLYQCTNNDTNRPGFNPVPSTRIYDVLVSTRTASGEVVIIGAVDNKSCINTWYIGPDGYGEKTLVKLNDKNFPDGIGSVFLAEGPCTGAETAANGISATVISDTSKLPDGISYIKSGIVNMYNCDLPSFGSDPWKLVHSESGEPQWYAGRNPVTVIPLSVPIGTTGNLWTMVAYATPVATSMEEQLNINYYASNQLLWNVTENYTTHTKQGWNEFANLAIPVGFLDGVPPMSPNGYAFTSKDINSRVDLNVKGDDSSTSSYSYKLGATISYGGKFLKDLVDMSASFGASVEDIRGAGITNTTTTDAYADLWQMMPGNYHSTFVYLAPVMETVQYDVADFYGTKPASHAETVFVTEMITSTPTEMNVQTYNCLNPPTSGPLAGTLRSPNYNDFSDWNWTTMSGGWYNRDWSMYDPGNPNPYFANYTTSTYFNDLDWESGSGILSSGTMKQSYSDSTTTEEDIAQSVGLFGFKESTAVTLKQTSKVETDITSGISFLWSMRSNESNCGGLDQLDMNIQLLKPLPGKHVPWVPANYSSYTPWLLTYNVWCAEPTKACNQIEAATAIESKIKTNVYPAGAGIIVLPSGGISKGTTGLVKAIPASGYEFLHWKGYGITLDDYSSPDANATVKTTLSTLQAYFGKKSSGLVDTAIIAIQNSSPGNQVKIEGTLPSGFNKQVALHLKAPIEVMIGDITFPFGPTAGDVTIVSDHEIAYTTTDPIQGVSNLRVNIGTNKWWFAANQVKNLQTHGVRSHIVPVSFGGKNLSVRDDLYMTGQEDISWSGKNEKISNKVFSLENATLSGKLFYLNDNLQYNALHLKDGDLNVSSVNATSPITMRMNGMKIEFGQATGVDGNLLTYHRADKDLNATVTVNNATMTWNAELSGRRLSHDYIPSGLSIGLQVGNNAITEVIHPNLTTHLKTQNLATGIEDAFLSGMNFGA
jgi:hypothetical protein